MNKAIREKVNETVNQLFPAFLSEFLSDHEVQISHDVRHQKTPQVVLNLVNTLRNFLSPDGNFPVTLTPYQQHNLKGLYDLLRDPQILFPDQLLSDIDKEHISFFMRLKLNRLLDQIINNYQLANPLRQQVNMDIAIAWWDKKTAEDKERIRREFENLFFDDRIDIFQHAYHLNANEDDSSLAEAINPLLLLTMCNQRMDEVMNRSFLWCIPPLFTDPYLIPNHSAFFQKEKVNPWLKKMTEGLLLTLTGLVASPVLAPIYAMKKLAHSVKHFFEGHKVLRSCYRIVGIGAGAYVGAVKGAFIGGLIGSIFPGAGTLIGSVIGGVLGAGLGGGLGAVLTKYSAKLISAICHPHAANPTNPDKYSLSKKEKYDLSRRGWNVDAIECMLKAIHREKKKIGFFNFNALVVGSKEHEQNSKWNKLIDDVKHGRIKEPFSIGNLYYDPADYRILAKDFQSSTAKVMPNFKAANDEMGKSKIIDEPSSCQSQDPILIRPQEEKTQTLDGEPSPLHFQRKTF